MTEFLQNVVSCEAPPWLCLLCYIAVKNKIKKNQEVPKKWNEKIHIRILQILQGATDTQKCMSARGNFFLSVCTKLMFALLQYQHFKKKKEKKKEDHKAL